MTTGSKPAGGAEQRRFERLPLNLDGWLSVAGQPAVPCTVRDFCQGGMFISADPAAYASAAPQTPATFYFALMVGGARRDLQLQVTIARAVAKGIGVTFVDPDPQAVGLLGQLAAASAPPPAAAAGASSPAAGGSAFAAEFEELRAPLTSLALEHVGRLVERFVERVDEALFLAARDAGNNLDQTRFLDGQREMRGRQARLREEVPRHVERAIAVIGSPLTEHGPRGGGQGDLSLVDKDEFEDFLVISEIVSELEPEFADKLHALCRRFGFLANRNVETSSLPVGPGVLCNAIAEPLKGLQSDRPVVQRIYKVLYDVLSGNLARFYDEVNDLLAARGVLPVIERDKPAVRRPPTPAPGAPEAVAPVQPPEQDFTDLMPGPEGYSGLRPAAAPAPAPVYPSAQPAGFRVAPAMPAPPPGVALAPNVAPPPMVAGGAVTPAPLQPPPGVGYAVAPAMPHPPPGLGVARAPGMPSGGQPVAPAPAMPPGMAGGVVAAGAMPPPGVAVAPPTIPGAGAAPPLTSAMSPEQLASTIARALLNPAQAAAQLPHYQLPQGWAVASSGYAEPSLRQAFSAAQSHLALRRQLLPEGEPEPSATLQARGAYSRTQLLDGLSGLQSAFADTSSPSLLDAATLKSRISAALAADGVPEHAIGDEAADALEVVAGLFGALLQDALVAKNAKQHLARLQPSVHRAALLDGTFFESSDHPVRQLVNRIAQLRDGKGEDFQRRDGRVGELVAEVNRRFHDDPAIFGPMLGELDTILQEQQVDYSRRVEDVVSSCEQQQRVLEQRRGTAGSADTHAERANLPEEWNKWLERSRRLEVGQQVIMNATSATANVVTLVWKEARNNLFVFVDNQGNKASTLTLQQVAMYLRRGIIRLLEEDPAAPALERAMVGVVDRLHGQVEAQATRDTLTGFLNRKAFIEAVESALPASEATGSKGVALALVAVDNLKLVNEQRGVSAGDNLIKACAEALARHVRGKDLLFGRVSGGELAVFWPSGGLQAAYKRMQATLEAMRNLATPVDPNDETVEIVMDEHGTSEIATTPPVFNPEVVGGVAGSDDTLVQAEPMLAAAREACEVARQMGPGSIYVAANESQQRRQLEQMVSYASKALERGCLVLSAQSVRSLRDSELPPALHIAVAARDRSDRPIPAQVFAPALARASTAAAVDQWVVRETLAWMQRNEEQVERYAVIIIPLSGASMKNEDLPGQLMELFMETAVPPGRICFELPDRDVVDNVVEAGELINTLREFGCRFVLDEFGSGHANYDYIKELEVDFVTVKSSFVADAQKSPKDFAMAKSISDLVHFMGKKTIAKQEMGRDLATTMREIGIDFLYDLAEQAQLVP